MMKSIICILLSFLLSGIPGSKANSGKKDEFKHFVKDFREAVKSGEPQNLAAFVKFPLITGTGGDAFYNYNTINESEFNSEFYQTYIVPFKKELSALKKSTFIKILKKGANLVSFTYGSTEDSMSDGIDYASAIPDGTTVFIYETCDKDDGPCIAFFVSLFGDSYKIWGITFGR